MKDFFEDYRLEEAKDMLRDCIFEALGKSVSLYDSAVHRSNILHFGEKAVALMEGAAVIFGKHPKQKSLKIARESVVQIEALLDHGQTQVAPAKNSQRMVKKKK